MDVRNDSLVVLGDLVGYPTVTSESNLDLIDYVFDRLDGVATEISITRDPTQPKANLFATIGPPVGGGVMLAGHTDVVPAPEEQWHGSPFLAVRHNDRIVGRGTADMKGFLACALAMAPLFADLPLQRPVHLALTFGEEIGCVGAPYLIADMTKTGVRPSAAIVGEPTSMRVITDHKGCFEYTTTVTGHEGHGSLPGDGVNAVEYAVRLIDRLTKLRDELAATPPDTSRFDPPYTTISVGRIEGGTARNILAGECSFEWEMRPVQVVDANHVKAEMRALEAELVAEMQLVAAHTGIETVVFGEVRGLHTDVGSPAVALMEALLDEVVLDTVSYGTEAGLYAEAGIPTVVCGPGSIEVAHQPDEYIEIPQMEACLEMMRRLGAHLCNTPDV